jgi:hypothetical protein
LAAPEVYIIRFALDICTKPRGFLAQHLINPTLFHRHAVPPGPRFASPPKTTYNFFGDTDSSQQMFACAGQRTFEAVASIIGGAVSVSVVGKSDGRPRAMQMTRALESHVIGASLRVSLPIRDAKFVGQSQQ